MLLTCGVDWAEAHHDVALVDVDGALLRDPESIPAPADSTNYWR